MSNESRWKCWPWLGESGFLKAVTRSPGSWSVLLALRSRGLGSVWTTTHLAKEREVAEVLGLPSTVTQAALFPVAYTAGTNFRPAQRPPAERSLFWNGWESG